MDTEDDDDTWSFEFKEEWSQLFKKCNWYNMSLIIIEFENEALLGNVEFNFMLFGLGFRWYWRYTETPDFIRLRELSEKIEKGDYSDLHGISTKE